MKQNLIRLFACAVSAACLLSLAACGGAKPNDGGKTSSTAPSSSAVQSGADAAVSTAGANGSALFANIEELMNSEEMQEQLASTLEGMKSDELEVAVSGEGNKLIYTFTYLDLEGIDREALKGSLADATENLGDTFENIASSLASTVEAADPSVVVIYKAPDGEELYNHEFTAK